MKRRLGDDERVCDVYPTELGTIKERIRYNGSEPLCARSIRDAESFKQEMWRPVMTVPDWLVQTLGSGGLIILIAGGLGKFFAN